MTVRIKVCGITRVEDALGCVEAGVDAIGVNLWPGSVRRASEEQAASIVEAIGDRARVVLVVVDLAVPEVERVRSRTGAGWVQLHGDEPDAVRDRLGATAMKAVRLGTAADLAAARGYGGDELLVDARVEGLPGGTGRACDWASAAVLARERRVWLAGGLDPTNVADAIRAVRPYGVDVASGVERAPGAKDLERVRAFVARARAA